jgi:hypothetical protein
MMGNFFESRVIFFRFSQKYSQSKLTQFEIHNMLYKSMGKVFDDDDDDDDDDDEIHRASRVFNFGLITFFGQSIFVFL